MWGPCADLPSRHKCIPAREKVWRELESGAEAECREEKMAAQNPNSRLLGPVALDQGRSSPLRTHLKNMRWAFLDLRKLWYQGQSLSPNSAMFQRKQGILACSIQFPGHGTQIRTQAAPFPGRALLPISSYSAFPSQPHDLAMRRSKNSFFLGF